MQAIRDDLAEADIFWNRESPVIGDAVAAVKQELVRTHSELRWQSAYVWPLAVFPYRARADVGAGRAAWIHDQLVHVAEFIRDSAGLLRDRLAP